MRSSATTVICTLSAIVLVALSGRYVQEHWLLGFVYSLQVELAAGVIAASVVALALGPRPVPLVFMMIAALFLAHGLAMRAEFEDRGDFATSEPASMLRVISFNVLFGNPNGRPIAEELRQSDADIVILLEAEPMRAHLPELEGLYPHRAGCETISKRCDTLILSRFPLANTTFETLSTVSPDRVIVTDVKYGAGSVALAAVHMTKPYYDGFFELESWNLERLLKKHPGPLIVAGDFNSAVYAPAMQRLLRKTRLATLAGEPATWPVWAGRMGISIDHVFARAPAHLRQVRPLSQSHGSNHRGLLAEIWLP